MTARKWFLAFLLVSILTIAGVLAMTMYYVQLPSHISQQEVLVLGNSQLAPGSTATFRVVVRNRETDTPISNTQVRASLKPANGTAQEVFTGTTDNMGTAVLSFPIAADMSDSHTLLVDTSSPLGTTHQEQVIAIQRDERILLTTDKPIYQPGQALHIRALVLGSFDLRPPPNGTKLDLVVADNKGNKVFRQTVTTSDFGVAAADFQLADEVNTGHYTIAASVGNTHSEKTVTVEYYVLPKFDVSLETARPYYLPGDHVEGTLNARYFFGKPVAGSAVKIEGSTFDVERTVVVNVQGTTDENGSYTFAFDLPTSMTGTEMDQGHGRFFLEASVTDETNHTETENLSLPISLNSLMIEAVPESGQLVLNTENLLYVSTSYPDGSPAETTVTLTMNDQHQTVQTGSYGVATIPFTPTDSYTPITLSAQDSSGTTTTSMLSFETDWASNVLLRPDRPIYQVGDTMNLTILTSVPGGTVYIDIIREGQTVGMQAVPVQGNHAALAVDLTPDLYGTLELHAYRIQSGGSVAGDTRLVVVDAANDLDLVLRTDEDVYRPGSSAGLDVQVRGTDGSAAPAALGLAVVDESVFALAEQDPGFARLAFLLEQELLTPAYELHGFSVPGMLMSEPSDGEDPLLRNAQQNSAGALLAPVSSRPVAFGFTNNSYDQLRRQATEAKQHYFTNLSIGLYGLILLLPVALVGINGVAARRERQQWRTIGLIFVGMLLVLFVLWLLMMFIGNSSAYALIPSAFGALGLIGVGGFVVLVGYTIVHRDVWTGWTLGLIALYAPLLVLTVYTVEYTGNQPPEIAVLIGFVLIALIPFALLIRASTLWTQQRKGAAYAAIVASSGGGIVTFTIMAGGLLMLGSRVDTEFENIDHGLTAGGAPMLADGLVRKEVAPGGAQDQDEAGAVASAAPRLRQYFPETMLWLPDATTDAEGNLHLDVPVADSITTWRITALASTQDGRIGSSTAGLRVFQDFFIDLNLPLALTVDDEVAVPVGVFNYLPDEQSVRLELEQADWFELLDEPTKTITIAANDIQVAYFRVRVKSFGTQTFKVTAIGSTMSDAIQKEVRVFPNGKQIFFTQSDQLQPDAPVVQHATIPGSAIDGTQNLTVKIYPGVISQVVEGLDSILQMPHGCFEQTSSSTYPNVLVLDYLQTTGQASPEVQFKAEEYINLGYQRLTTFEVIGGGFSLFGNAPADLMLTAYGVQEFTDMSRVHPVDQALIDRTAQWLLSQQQSDGSWVGQQGFHESSLTNQSEQIPVTAYVVWSLVDAGFNNDARTQQGVAYLRSVYGQVDDPYVLALVANALVATDEQAQQQSSETQAALDRLAGMAKRDNEQVYWEIVGTTYMGGYGQAGRVETTALAALALLRSGTHPDLANGALLTLVKAKDSFGTWYNTSATIMSLKALIQSVRDGEGKTNAQVTVTLNGQESRTVDITPETFDVVQLLTFNDMRAGTDNEIRITMEGEGRLMYQVTGSYYLPWEDVPQPQEQAEPVTIDVGYDRTSLSVDETVTVSVSVRLNQPGTVETTLVDLGLPPGFSVVREDLDRLVAAQNDTSNGAPAEPADVVDGVDGLPADQDTTPPAQAKTAKIERYELTSRQIILYITGLNNDQPVHFSYRLRATFPLVVQTPASTAYDYYNPDKVGEIHPLRLEVVE